MPAPARPGGPWCCWTVGEVDASPEGFESAVAATLGPPRGGPTAEPVVTADLLVNAVLLVDGYEQLAPIDSWLRHQFIPALAADDVVVLAGRDAPAPAWRVDAGWRHVVAIHRLDPFDPAESDRLLALAGVAAPDRSRLTALGRGHPLAMALLADAARTGSCPGASPTSPRPCRRCSTRCCADLLWAVEIGEVRAGDGTLGRRRPGIVNALLLDFVGQHRTLTAPVSGSSLPR